MVIGPSVIAVDRSTINSCIALKKSLYPSVLENPFFDGVTITYNPEDVVFEDEGLVYNGDRSEIIFVPLDVEGMFTIDELVSSIGGYAFCGCSLITSISMGDSMRSMGHNAFQDCSALNSVVLGESVDFLCTSAFSGCSDIGAVVCLSNRKFPENRLYSSFYAFFP